jgi:hypothetical protein
MRLSIFRIVTVAALIAATGIVGVAQTEASGARPPNPAAPVGLFILIVCILRRKKEIGGWLLYFLIQMFGGALISVVLLYIGIENYLPGRWSDSALYTLFLLSTIPGALIVTLMAIGAAMLLRTRQWVWVVRLRLLVAADLVTGLISLLIDSLYFPDNLFFSVLALLLPCILLPYLFLSRRVRGVFLTKDWSREVHTQGPVTAVTGEIAVSAPDPTLNG